MVTKRTSRPALLGLLVVLSAIGSPHSVPFAQQGRRQLPLIATHALNVPEPSDLAIDESGTTLWTTADRLGKVYQLTLEGRVIRTLKFIGEDLEGVAYDRSDSTLWVAEERRRELIHLDLEGNILSRHPLDLSGAMNSGLEGVCIDAKGGMFALNEKQPGLFLILNRDVAIVARKTLSFAKDYSGMTYDRKRECFWIVSDQSRALYLWDRRKGVIREYHLPFPKAEGIAVDEAAKRIYIVSDSERRLYVYRLEG